jgi:hypothetical protein
VPGTPPEERRLFIHASAVCNMTGWQMPYALLATLLVGIPVGIPFVAAWSLRKPQGVSRHWLEAVRAGMRPALVELYGPLYWWEAALMLQRLVSGGTAVAARTR